MRLSPDIKYRSCDLSNDLLEVQNALRLPICCGGNNEVRILDQTRLILRKLFKCRSKSFKAGVRIVLLQPVCEGAGLIVTYVLCT